MNIFSGLEELGFTNLNSVPLFKNEKREITKEEKKTMDKSLEDIIYGKSYTCPVCDNEFLESTLKTGKTRLVDTQTDLRPIYEPLDPMYYDVVLCKSCGYAAIRSSFQKITERQIDLILNKIKPLFKSREYPKMFTLDNAIERYKLALLNSCVKNGQAGEKAFICLKLAWLHRSKNDPTAELLFIENAYVGFEEAFTKENFPICGIDENTLTYLMGELARRLGKYEDSLRFLSRVITSRNVTQRLKNRAMDIKELIKKEREAAAN